MYLKYLFGDSENLIRLRTSTLYNFGSLRQQEYMFEILNKTSFTDGILHMSHLVGKPTMWFSNRPDTNRPVQAQKRARILKFLIYIEEELYYPSSENKGADQLRGYREADLRLCFRLCRLLVFP